jgi:antitoxin MazE
MRARLVQIGNSRGIRIPKPLLEQTGLHDEVEIEVRGEQLVIRAANPPRAGWRSAETMHCWNGNGSSDRGLAWWFRLMR